MASKPGFPEQFLDFARIAIIRPWTIARWRTER